MYMTVFTHLNKQITTDKIFMESQQRMLLVLTVQQLNRQLIFFDHEQQKHLHATDTIIVTCQLLLPVKSSEVSVKKRMHKWLSEV